MHLWSLQFGHGSETDRAYFTMEEYALLLLSNVCDARSRGDLPTSGSIGKYP
jgi:hypothetical protein